MTTKLDFDAAYRVAGYDGIAFRLDEWQTETVGEWVLLDPDSDPDDEDSYVWDEDERPTGMLVAHMIGDDRPFVIDPDDVTVLDQPICSCGQIGCGWHGETD